MSTRVVYSIPPLSSTASHCHAVLQIEIRADDLPREAVERLEVCAKHTALLDLVAAKDRILLQLIRERDELLSQVQQLEQGELHDSWTVGTRSCATIHPPSR